jgi:FtsX-like permease family
MAVYIFKLGFYLTLLLFGGGAVFVGCVIALAAAKSGKLNVTNHDVTTVYDYATQPVGFWLTFAMACVFPVIAGALAIRYSRRKLASLHIDGGTD